MASELDPETKRRVEEFVGDWLVDANVPGASLAVVRDDELVYASGFGSRDLETNEPATAETLYGVASVTKSFAATAICLLEERGELSVEDPVTDYLDEVAIRGEDGPFTLHDLLSHSSGLPTLRTSSVLLYRLTGVEEHGIPLGDREDFYRHLNGAQEEIAGPRGERFMYSNAGYNLLGDVVEAVSGTPFDRFVEAEILRPLGMERATFDPDALEGEDAMTPYALEDGEPEAVPFPHRPVSYAAGGLIASVEELTRYLRMQANGGSLDGVDLVSADALARAHTGYVERADSEYGYGWGRSEFLGRTLIGHGGSLGVASSYVGFTEDGEYAIAMAANATPAPTPPTVAKGVLAILEGEEPTETVPYFARDERFDELTGEYESYRGITAATVERRGAVLELTVEGALGDQTLTLLPTDPEDPGYEFEVPTMMGARRSAEFE
uniref:serine hydrolase n=1 Tax=Halovivax sp. TaxID=1935978 RepID=UPI0025C621ED